ncbi:MAG: hypothetical protein QOE06_1186 [Thermoleophilaceae bacterium]|jgi:hypothetical protein|nr:hypothetical protein [Thermoleophilaceae bacterium]
MPSYRLAIPPERLESCIRRLDPADRALLDLSLNRGIPDVAIAAFVRTDPTRLAWKRARAIERVASRMGLSEPASLSEVRTALGDLPSRAWLPLELQAAPVPAALAPPEPAGAEPRVFPGGAAFRSPVRPTSPPAQGLAVRGAAAGSSQGMAPVAAAPAPRARSLARRAAGAVLVGAAAALAFRRR